MNLAILFGSSSNEHEVSVVSAASIIKNLDKQKYHITPIYMDKNNCFYEWLEPIENIKPLNMGILPTNLKLIEQDFLYFKQFDLVFIMIHGKNGEDGILSSIFDFLNIKYVGNHTTPSAITMDKIITKEILEANGIKTTPFLAISKYNNEYLFKNQILKEVELKRKIHSTFHYPIFIKPANSGSSVGVYKLENENELKNAFTEVFKIDHRILIEKAIQGQELEVGILEKNHEIIASIVGEIGASDSFYSYDAKYHDKNSKTFIPAHISPDLCLEIQKIAIQAFKILDLHGYSRIDFFVTPDQNILLNEINTIPGFTEISMYPKLMEASGIPYSDLLNILIENALQNYDYLK